MRVRSCLSMLAFFWLCACGGGAETSPTRIVVVVDATSGLAAQLDRVTLEESTSDQRTSLWLKNAPSGSDNGKLPLIFQVQKGSLNTASVAVLGYAGETLLIERRADLTFDEGKTRVLSILLSDRCSRVVCSADQTCGDCGSCVPRAIESDSLIQVDDPDDALSGLTPIPCEEPRADGGMDAAMGALDAEVPDADVPDADVLDAAMGSDGDAGGADGAVAELSIVAPGAVARAGCYALEIAQSGTPSASISATGAALFSDAGCTSSVPNGTSYSEASSTVYVSLTPPTLAGEPNARSVSIQLSAGNTQVSHVIELRKPAKRLLRSSTSTCVQLVDDTMQCMGTTEFGMTGVTSSQVAMVARPTKAPNLNYAFSMLRARGGTACGILAGAARCWGQDSWGQLGDGGDYNGPPDEEDDGASFSGFPQPVSVIGLTSQVTQIDTSGEHSCAVMNGQAYCWGRNDDGRIEASDIQGFDAPRLRSGLGGTVIDVATSNSQSCALMADDSVKCWRNQGPNPSVVTSESFGAASPVAIEAAYDGICALTDQGVYCWGDNGYGELGYAGNQADPQKVNLPNNLNGAWLGLASANAQVCAYTAAELFCWGSNSDGRLGAGGTGSAPVKIPLPAGEISDVAIGGNPWRNATCAIVDGLTYCWGFHLYGELGISERVGDQLVPISVPLLDTLDPDAVFLSAFTYNGDGVSGAVKDGGASFWGWGHQQQLGEREARAASIVPREIAGLSSGVAQLSFGTAWAMARANGKAYTWGTGYYGAIAAGTTTERTLPGEVTFGSGDKTVRDVAAGTYHGCAVVSDDAMTDKAGVYCWGRRAFGEVGDGSMGVAETTTPLLVVPETSSATDVAAADAVSCAVVNEGLLCWGGFNNQSVPTAVSGLTSGILKVELSEEEVCVLTSAKAVKCVRVGSSSILTLAMGGPVAELKAAPRHMCARREDGAVYCWGQNDYGQLGNGTRIDHQDDPVAVQGLSGAVSQFAVGYELGMSCARDAQGWKCWGNNGLHGMGLEPFTQTSPRLILGWEN